VTREMGVGVEGFGNREFYDVPTYLAKHVIFEKMGFVESKKVVGVKLGWGSKLVFLLTSY